MPVRLNGQGAPNLAEVLRAAGHKVDEVTIPNWVNLSRAGNSSWYADGRPTHIVCHDTAVRAAVHSTIEGERSQARQLAYTHAVKPVCNLYLGKSLTWYLIAAGPTNTNGAGRDRWGGGVPDNSMNSYAIGIEAANDGVGEEWTDEFLAEYVRGCHTLSKAYNIPINNIRQHSEWAPDRKIDLSAGTFKCRYTMSSKLPGKFDFDLWRSDVDAHNIVVPVMPSIPFDLEEEEMGTKFVVIRFEGHSAHYKKWGEAKVWIPGPKALQALYDRVAWDKGTGVDPEAQISEVELRRDSGSRGICESFGPLVGPRPGDVDDYGWPVAWADVPH